MFESPIRCHFSSHITTSATHFGVTALRLNGTRFTYVRSIASIKRRCSRMSNTNPSTVIPTATAAIGSRTLGVAFASFTGPVKVLKSTTPQSRKLSSLASSAFRRQVSHNSAGMAMAMTNRLLPRHPAWKQPDHYRASFPYPQTLRRDSERRCGVGWRACDLIMRLHEEYGLSITLPQRERFRGAWPPQGVINLTKNPIESIPDLARITINPITINV
jgi:hypothetical protein